jgi:hypothetical protein
MNKIAYKLPEVTWLRAIRLSPSDTRLKFLSRGSSVDLDLSGVYSISESYSDEIFGVLVVKFGATVLKQVKVRNASPSILKSIAKAINVCCSNEVASKKVHSVGFDGAYAVC